MTTRGEEIAFCRQTGTDSPKYCGILSSVSRKRNRKKKGPIGRDSLRDVQERAIPRRSQYDARSKDISKAGRERKRSRNEDGANEDGEKLVMVAPASIYKSTSFWLWFVALGTACLFAFWQTFKQLELTWRNEADYSHGYLVVPLALLILWHRRETFPGVRESVDWWGLTLICIAVAMRCVASLAYMEFLDGYALVPLVGGMIWLLCGAQTLRWATPGLLLLVMLVPLPYRFETTLSWELQGIATLLSTAMLRTFGEPAISEGHIIWVGNLNLSVEQECSGLRIFVGIFALAFFWCGTVTRSWIDRLVIMLAAVPIALLVNSLRITTMGILLKSFDSPSARTTIHDWLGYLMIPLAAGMLWLVKYYWENVYKEVDFHSRVDKRSEPATAKA